MGEITKRFRVPFPDFDYGTWVEKIGLKYTLSGDLLTLIGAPKDMRQFEAESELKPEPDAG